MTVPSSQMAAMVAQQQQQQQQLVITASSPPSTSSSAPVMTVHHQAGALVNGPATALSLAMPMLIPTSQLPTFTMASTPAASTTSHGDANVNALNSSSCGVNALHSSPPTSPSTSISQVATAF